MCGLFWIDLVFEAWSWFLLVLFCNFIEGGRACLVGMIAVYDRQVDLSSLD